MPIGSENSASDAAKRVLANLVLNEGLAEALDTMNSMVGNAGQQTVYNNYVLVEFKKTRSSIRPGDDWPGIDIGEYMDFMGIIVEEGNSIMEEACDFAADIIAGVG
jgi:hypothetical protein